jgi:3-hydroxybutyryl-CoA dehydratase
MTTNGKHSGRELDDLEVGTSFTSPGRTITETDLVSFSALTGDWHPQHTNAAWAAASPFGGRIAHGMLVLSYAIGLVPLDAARVVALRGVTDVVFKRPVHIGDTIRVQSRVDGVRPLDADTALVDLGWKILSQSDEGVARGRLAVVWRRGATRPEPEDVEKASHSEPHLDEVFL